MKYKFKLEINENGTWQDYTEHCIQPFSLKDKYDETLATMTVKMYLNRAETITPSAKARFSIYEKSGTDFVLKDTYDLMVDTDNAYKEVLAGDGCWAHELVFTEPLAFLQKYTVDNILLTYQLEDVVQYLDTGALKGDLKLVSTKGIQAKLVDVPSDATYKRTKYYKYYFDPGRYTSREITTQTVQDANGNNVQQEVEHTVEHLGLNEWSKVIYFKARSGYNQLYRRNAAGNEIACGYYAYPYIPYCPLWCEEYDPTTGTTVKFQMSYDVYVEEIDLTTGEVIVPERLLRTVEICKDDRNQFRNGLPNNFTEGPRTPIQAGEYVAGSNTIRYVALGVVNNAFKRNINDLFVDYYNSSYQAYYHPPQFGAVTYYWFTVKPNRRYKMRYVRNRNIQMQDPQFGLNDANFPLRRSEWIKEGLPTKCVAYIMPNSTAHIPIGEENNLQYPEMQYSFDVLDLCDADGNFDENETIDAALPTPEEYAYKYNCYEYLRKAFYATGSYKADAPLPFAMTDAVRQKLQQTPIYESQNMGNTLYDVCLYIGRYLHAVPYCYYGENDLIYLDFLPYGQSDETPDTGRITSLYNSRNFAEYLSSFDSYVSNLVNNDSDIEEVICAKSDDGSSLVYADNAVLLLSRPCYGIKEFYVAKRSAPNDWKPLVKNSSLRGASFVCEKSIYNILDFREQYTPNKGCCLFYTLGGTKIEGLQYKRPNPISAGEENTAIQNIIGRVWWYDTIAAKVNVNDYIFKIKYRTYDDTRVRLFRPDLKKYMLNTVNDRYPMQRTFRSQTEKVVNSDFYGRNLTGELVRTGNEVKQRDYIVESYDEVPRCGQLRNIDGVPHYVSEVTIPFYNEYISATAIYSKDFQRLSSIVSIPAENRFYEIATQGVVKRTVIMDEFIEIDTAAHPHNSELSATGKRKLLDRILSNSTTPVRYAVITFKNKADNPHAWSISVIKPVHSFSMHSGFGMTVEMEDNYSAGSQVLSSSGFNFTNASNMAGAFNTLGKEIATAYAEALLNAGINGSSRAYRALLPLRYCDQYGNADLFDIRLYGELTLSANQIAAQPLLIDSLDAVQPLFVSTDNELRKDNREAIAIAPQFNAIAMQDDIIIGPGFWKEKHNPVRCYAFTAPLNKNDEFIPELSTGVGFTYTDAGVITLSNVPQSAAAIAFAYENADGDRELIFGINKRATTIALSFVRNMG